ncbi:MAG: hypothetical protein H6702_05480 [Myxococcales bacterium]|nr:hypothetical protein [Myxococcales bacterium]
MAARLILPGLFAAALSGCFSSADFSECTSSVQCGRGYRCEANACVPQGGAGDGGVVDFSGRPDQATGEDVQVIEGGRFTEAQGDQSFPGKTLVLRGQIIVDSLSGVTFSAKAIRLEGTLEVLGPAGGPGGGGGAGGHTDLQFVPGGRVDSPQRGSLANGTTGGDGGPGSRGLGVNGGQAGEPGEVGNPDGLAGGDGRFPITSCDDQATLQVGCSGGGGGGGKGANGGAVCDGGGGGGGGGRGARAARWRWWPRPGSSSTGRSSRPARAAPWRWPRYPGRPALRRRRRRLRGRVRHPHPRLRRRRRPVGRPRPGRRRGRR